jgi:hypothetical protein
MTGMQVGPLDILPFSDSWISYLSRTLGYPNILEPLDILPFPYPWISYLPRILGYPNERRIPKFAEQRVPK